MSDYSMGMWQDTDTDDLFTAATNPNPQTAKARYRILSASDALLPPPPTEWVVKNLIEAGTLSAIYGDPGCGKTWALLDLSVSVGLGKDWLNFETKKSTVLLIDEESGERRLMRRLGEVLRGHHADEKTPIFSVSYGRFDLGNRHDPRELEALIQTTGAKLVIIDALSDVAPGRDENATKDMKPILLALKSIAEDTNAAIIVIHHSNKQGGYRGATTIKADVDIMIKVEKEKHKDLITFTSEKVRDGASVNFSARANWMTLDPKEFWLDSFNVPNSKRNYNKAQRYILLYLFQNGESASKDMIDRRDPIVDPAAKTISNELSNLKAALLVERTDNGGTSAGTYKLTDLGKQEAENL